MELGYTYMYINFYQKEYTVFWGNIDSAVSGNIDFRVFIVDWLMTSVTAALLNETNDLIPLLVFLHRKLKIWLIYKLGLILNKNFIMVIQKFGKRRNRAWNLLIFLYESGFKTACSMPDKIYFRWKFTIKKIFSIALGRFGWSY